MMSFKSGKSFQSQMLSPEQLPMSATNYVSIMKRKDMESNILSQDQLNFNPKMIGGKIGTLLDLQQRENGTPLIKKYANSKPMPTFKSKQSSINFG